ncbi:MAG: GGDEF domain-containing protein [Desulfobacterales bacterium]|jgi:diguanylate cyclase (GGDEF)-like protein|nr:GGDEF domain-containing protein [Desulfobacterales bacterium]
MNNDAISNDWLDRIERIDFAFQPIVNIHSGVCYGYEALLRNWEAAGFTSIGNLFDRAFNENILHQVDLRLREKAIHKFADIAWCRFTKLFYNLDNRLFDSSDYKNGQTIRQMEKLGLPHTCLCFEISEKHQLADGQKAAATFCTYRTQGFRIAVDDCGSGFSGLKLLYYAEPDYIKIDRFFIMDIETDAKKRLFVSSIVEIAHLMGAVVVAEGVQTRQEFYGCRSIGCDLVQGYLVQKPQTDISELQKKYDTIELMSQSDRRYDTTIDQTLIKTEMRHLPPIQEDQDIITVFEKFREDKNSPFFPVINHNGEPLGIIRESAFKDYAYSRYGRQLLENPTFGKSLSRFISKFPVASLTTSIEKVLKIFAQNETLEGLLILEDLKYIGFLSAQSLLKILNEKNLSIARDQNPLTKLPGNTIIYEYISTALSDLENQYYCIHFDFDNFKAFNDKYGFRHGDRLILRFAELLSSFDEFAGKLVGHIGGDDFFLGLKNLVSPKVITGVRRLAAQFKNDAESFYEPEAVRDGFILTRDREGQEKKIPLLTVSTSILVLPPGDRGVYSVENIGTKLAAMKKTAKQSDDKLCISEIAPEFPRLGLRLAN